MNKTIQQGISSQKKEKFSVVAPYQRMVYLSRENRNAPPV